MEIGRASKVNFEFRQRVAREIEQAVESPWRSLVPPDDDGPQSEEEFLVTAPMEQLKKYLAGKV